VQILETRQGLRIAAPEEVAFRAGFIDVAQLRKLGEAQKKSSYGAYLLRLADEAH